jgi:hypothetical protein
MRILLHFTTSLLILLSSFSGSAQCTPDPTPNNNGVYPSTLENGCVNSSYTDTSTLVFSDTLVAGFLVSFDSIYITGFSNVPAGLTVVCGSASCQAYPSGPSGVVKECLLFSGTPTVPVTSNVIQVYVTAWVTLFGSPQVVSDSVQITLTINNSSTSSETVTACDDYLWAVDANTYTTTGMYTIVMPNAAGCDSTITLDLTINPTPVNSVTQVGLVLTADAAGVTYQWLDCDNSHAIIAGATSQSYSGPSGNYAVQVSSITGGCTDTSACFNLVVGIMENSFGNTLTVYPNPTAGNVNITLGETYKGISVEVTDVLGKIIQTKSFNSTSEIALNLVGENGYYFVKITSDSGEAARIKVLKK